MAENSRQPREFLSPSLQSRERNGQTEKWTSADRHHRNSINVQIGDFAPVFWIAACIKRLTLLDHVASWRSPEGGRAVLENEQNHCWRDRDGASVTETERERENSGGKPREAEGEKEKEQPRRERGRHAGREGRRERARRGRAGGRRRHQVQTKDGGGN